MPPSPSSGPPLLSASWSPPLFWGTPFLAAGDAFLCAGEAFLGSDSAGCLALAELDTVGALPALLPPPQPATTSATSATAAVARTMMRLLGIMFSPPVGENDGRTDPRLSNHATRSPHSGNLVVAGGRTEGHWPRVSSSR